MAENIADESSVGAAEAARKARKKEKRQKKAQDDALTVTQEETLVLEVTDRGAEEDRKARKKEKRRKKAQDDALTVTQGETPAVEATEEGAEEARKARKKEKRLKKLKSATAQENDATVIISENTKDTSDTTKPELKEKVKTETSKSKSRKKKKEGSLDKVQETCITDSSAQHDSSSKSYLQHSDLSALPQTAIDTFLSENFISISDPLAKTLSLRPLINFAYLPFSDPAHLAHFKTFKAPTPIQAAAWPFLFSGRDVIGIAETGSGKTMAFAVPCLKKILALPSNQRVDGAKAVIVSPTRELAMQSYEQIVELCKSSGIKAVCVYGGVSKDEQRRSLRTADIVVATPGRLNDLINEGCADLSRVNYVVLDEADRMLDKGFEEEIKKIIHTTPPVAKRQTLMFTATWPESVRALASTFMKSPIKIAIGDNPSGDLRANNRIVQKVEVVEPRNKEFRLLQLLKEHQSGSQKDDRIIVFALYKKEATRIESFIRTKGFRVAGIHGDLSQEQRTRSLESFKSGKTPLLVATDVAARGLDIPSVKLVLNLTFPLTVEDYVHRIGRTGRAGKEGLAITLFTEHDKAHSGALINVLKAAKQEVPESLLKFGTTVKRKEHDAYGAFARDVDMTQTAKKIKFD
ncbi:ATP-dependent RNA helicase of the DEAD-box family [Blumeria graminis f. sp. tritici 96224]|uniref:RNA helicase n=1 Tax=Blumeria graminis f. sp. tritici 96224 TaxID=1268274 RepID=A0A656KJI3_BLUGR|nr:ATP-dependent RNA helicase of the DEAD-box family [Blumeria graminis f. sp. tritici 96224]